MDKIFTTDRWILFHGNNIFEFNNIQKYLESRPQLIQLKNMILIFVINISSLMAIPIRQQINGELSKHEAIAAITPDLAVYYLKLLQ